MCNVGGMGLCKQHRWGRAVVRLGAGERHGESQGHAAAITQELAEHPEAGQQGQVPSCSTPARLRVLLAGILDSQSHETDAWRHTSMTRHMPPSLKQHV